jgi:hypothetical protein
MLKLIEGFEGFGTVIGTGNNITAVLAEKYGGHGSGPYYLDTGAFGGYSIYSNTTGTTQYMSFGTGTTSSTLIFGFAFKIVSNSSGTIMWIFCGPGANLALRIQWTSSGGEFLVYNEGEGNKHLGTTSGAGVTNGSGWHYVEFKILCHSSAGSVDVHVDGVSRLSVSGVNTARDEYTYYSVINMHAMAQNRLDDIYIADDTGAINNDFLGRHSVVGLLPESDTATREWTPSSGTSHYDLIDENPSDDDTTYVSSNIAGYKDLYKFNQIDQGGVTAIQVNTICRCPDTATDMKIDISSGGTLYPGSSQDVNFTTSYGTVQTVIETDPNTSAQWTADGLNAAKIGFEVA